MVSLISGKKGSGKSKQIIKMANECVDVVDGNVVYIDDNKRSMLELHHDLRFIALEEFPIDSVDEFFGFLCGLISNDYDIEKVFVDGIMNCLEVKIEELPRLLSKMDDLAETNEIEFIITLSYDGELPDELETYIL